MHIFKQRWAQIGVSCIIYGLSSMKWTLKYLEEPCLLAIVQYFHSLFGFIKYNIGTLAVRLRECKSAKSNKLVQRTHETQVRMDESEKQFPAFNSMNGKTMPILIFDDLRTRAFNAHLWAYKISMWDYAAKTHFFRPNRSGWNDLVPNKKNGTQKSTDSYALPICFFSIRFYR